MEIMQNDDDSALNESPPHGEGPRTDVTSGATVQGEKALLLHAKLARRVERGHLWVFSNEVRAEQGDPEPGDEVAVYDHRRRIVGMALYSRSSLIRGRIYSRRRGQPCDAALIGERLRQALAYRRALGALPHSYRLLNSEADGLPGAVVDVFGDHVVIQISTAGIDRRRADLLAAVRELLSPACVIERGDSPFAALEGLSGEKRVAFGEPTTPTRIEENGVVVLADLMEGQKTGYYLDQVRNRALARPLLAGRRVLDLFCYVGAWSLMAGEAGASSVLGVDSSARALELAEAARELNPGARDRVAFQKADVFARLRELAGGGERFDAVILDPPPLARSKRDVRDALRGYRELNLRAMQILNPGGLLVTCCCSHAVGEEEFAQVVSMAAKDARADCTVLHRPTQPPDHPIHLQTPETAYLKTLILVRREF
jgi:23S rRNA (cytosine1962-C5)-methyltransferase